MTRLGSIITVLGTSTSQKLFLAHAKTQMAETGVEARQTPAAAISLNEGSGASLRNAPASVAPIIGPRQRRRRPRPAYGAKHGGRRRRAAALWSGYFFLNQKVS